MIIDGKIIAQELLAALREKKPLPRGVFLAAVLIGEDPASIHFLAQKEKAARQAGIDFRLYRFPLSISQAQIEKEIKAITQDPLCGGCLVQLPLPPGLDRQAILDLIPEEKDVDLLGGVHFESSEPVSLAPSVLTVIEILERAHVFELKDKTVAIVGLGYLIGKPVLQWIRGRAKEVITFDSRSGNVKKDLLAADIVVSGTGQPGLFSAENLKEGALVIDFGYGNMNGKILGDFDPHGAEEKGIAYTKTPGGTGPILVAKLLENFYSFCSREMQ